MVERPAGTRIIPMIPRIHPFKALLLPLPVHLATPPLLGLIQAKAPQPLELEVVTPVALVPPLPPPAFSVVEQLQVLPLLPVQPVYKGTFSSPIFLFIPRSVTLYICSFAEAIYDLAWVLRLSG